MGKVAYLDNRLHTPQVKPFWHYFLHVGKNFGPGKSFPQRFQMLGRRYNKVQDQPITKQLYWFLFALVQG